MDIMEYDEENKYPNIKVFKEKPNIIGTIYFDFLHHSWHFRPKAEIVLDRLEMLNIANYINNLPSVK